MTKKTTSKGAKPEQVFYLGLGLASMAKNSLDTAITALMREGKTIVKDKSKYQEKLIKEGKKAYGSLIKNLEETFDVALKKMNIPSRKEFEELKRKVEGRKKSVKK